MVFHLLDKARVVSEGTEYMVSLPGSLLAQYEQMDVHGWVFLFLFFCFFFCNGYIVGCIVGILN